MNLLLSLITHNDKVICICRVIGAAFIYYEKVRVEGRWLDSFNNDVRHIRTHLYSLEYGKEKQC